MPSLTSMPNEVILGIIELLTNEDLENSTWTCKQVLNMGDGPLSKHRKIEEEYGTIRFDESSHMQGGHCHPAFLRDIIANKSIATYPKKICICYSDVLQIHSTRYVSLDDDSTTDRGGIVSMMSERGDALGSILNECRN